MKALNANRNKMQSFRLIQSTFAFCHSTICVENFGCPARYGKNHDNKKM